MNGYQVQRTAEYHQLMIRNMDDALNMAAQQAAFRLHSLSDELYPAKTTGSSDDSDPEDAYSLKLTSSRYPLRSRYTVQPGIHYEQPIARLYTGYYDSHVPPRTPVGMVFPTRGPTCTDIAPRRQTEEERLTSYTVLRKAYEENQYSSRERTRILTKLTGINSVDIQNWFRNSRRRDRRKEQRLRKSAYYLRSTA